MVARVVCSRLVHPPPAMWYHYSHVLVPACSLVDVRPCAGGDDIPPAKPRGLWLSLGGSWKEWCAEHRVPCGACVQPFTLTADAKVFVVESSGDLFRLMDEFGEPWPVAPAVWRVRWDAMAALGYDGVAFKDYSRTKTEVLCSEDFDLAQYNWFFAIDVDSCCIWTPSRAIASCCNAE